MNSNDDEFQLDPIPLEVRWTHSNAYDFNYCVHKKTRNSELQLDWVHKLKTVVLGDIGRDYGTNPKQFF